ncbi:conserved hypothetical protein [Thiomonas sp. CB2]|uniref:Uncharacterized protein n=1 Tax=Thiomonas arsenitoxydans (strain DSM 22701 / CIP 110005 / 3As) TaxID=426114 RepID=D6CNN6_THIA3|nr:hypothetical protein THI_3581 [Thiomonas arsenitoxydans]CDW93607.1 conserved hypothetical protein [Thiomonas sp. CB2]VDY04982.1 conserved protein of unknown function [Thiomonas sp. Bio17B3]VDY07851.1 conserved protein of unknown function [Thiomonas sp. Sup16B3]VDY13228.1 hypothetical protein TOC7_20016 [Thiomonas sp. OC7]
MLQQKADLPPLLERCGSPFAPVWCERTKDDRADARGGASKQIVGRVQARAAQVRAKCHRTVTPC